MISGVTLTASNNDFSAARVIKFKGNFLRLHRIIAAEIGRDSCHHPARHHHPFKCIIIILRANIIIDRGLSMIRLHCPDEEDAILFYLQTHKGAVQSAKGHGHINR